MFQNVFTQEELESTQDLIHYINATGCSIKVENQSMFALDIYRGAEQFDRVNPYAFLVIPNGDYTLKINRNIKSENMQPYNFVSFKTVNGEVKTESGSTNFTGTQTIEGDVNVEGTVNIDGIVNVAGNVGIEGEVNVNGTVEVAGDVNVQGNVEVNNVVKTETIIQNATIPITAPNGIDVNIQNASIPITGEVSISSGVIEANINNAEIKTELVNASVSTNPVVSFGKGYQDKWLLIGTGTNLAECITSIHEKAGMYDTIVLSFSTIVYRERTNAILSGPMCDEKQSLISMFLSGMPYNAINISTTYREFMGEDGVSVNEVIGTGSTTKYVRDIARGEITIKATEPFLFNEISLRLRFPTNTIIQETGDKVYCKLDAHVFNSKSFNYIKEGGSATLSYLDMNGGINMHNKSISGIDGMYFNDPTDGGAEGINFPRTNGGNDLLRVLNGQLLLNNAVVYEELTTVYTALDLNNLTRNGTYYTHTMTDAIGRPPNAASAAAFITHKERAGGYAIQTYETATVGNLQIWVRRKVAGTWETWRQLQFI